MFQKQCVYRQVHFFKSKFLCDFYQDLILSKTVYCFFDQSFVRTDIILDHHFIRSGIKCFFNIFKPLCIHSCYKRNINTFSYFFQCAQKLFPFLVYLGIIVQKKLVCSLETVLLCHVYNIRRQFILSIDKWNNLFVSHSFLLPVSVTVHLWLIILPGSFRLLWMPYPSPWLQP